MKYIKKKAAMHIFYYLMLVDGAVSDSEKKTFREIGQELDPDHFVKYEEEIMETCEEKLKAVIDEEDYYEAIAEAVDTLLYSETNEPSEGISKRLLIWDLLVLAFSNEEYNPKERRLIKHIFRKSQEQKDILLEMEHLISTDVAIKKESAWAQTANRPYSEIRPIVDKLEKRESVVFTAAKTLVEDKLFEQVEKAEIPEDKVGEAVAKVGGVVAGAAKETGKVAGNVVGGAKFLFTGLFKPYKKDED